MTTSVTMVAGEVRHDPVHHAVGFRVETPDGVAVISGDTLVGDEVATLARGAVSLIVADDLTTVTIGGT